VPSPGRAKERSQGGHLWKASHKRPFALPGLDKERIAMDPFEMVVAIVFIACAFGVLDQVIKVGAARRSSLSDRLETELAAVRQEITALRAWSSDLILSFDSTLHQL